MSSARHRDGRAGEQSPRFLRRRAPCIRKSVRKRGCARKIKLPCSVLKSARALFGCVSALFIGGRGGMGRGPRGIFATALCRVYRVLKIKIEARAGHEEISALARFIGRFIGERMPDKRYKFPPRLPARARASLRAGARRGLIYDACCRGDIA